MRESEVLTPPHLHFKLASEQVSSAVARRRHFPAAISPAKPGLGSPWEARASRPTRVGNGAATRRHAPPPSRASSGACSPRAVVPAPESRRASAVLLVGFSRVRSSPQFPVSSPGMLQPYSLHLFAPLGFHLVGQNGFPWTCFLLLRDSNHHSC